MKTILLSLIILLGITGCGDSSYYRSTVILEKYPDSELIEFDQTYENVRFMVRTPSGDIRMITFYNSLDIERYTDKLIFQSKKSVTNTTN